VTFSLWVCGRCSTVIRSEGAPEECYEDQGGCKRLLGDMDISGPFPEGAKDALEIVERYRALRMEDGLAEPEAIEAIDRERDEPPEIIRMVLGQSCLLDEWPVGWHEEDWPKLAKWSTFADVEYWLGRVVDTSETNRLILPLLAAQGHLAPLLRAIGPAVHIIPKGGRISAGKTRCGEVVTYLGAGLWLASATVPALKSARKDGPRLLGIDEGDEAERDNPGVKAYLLASHDWGAVYLKFSEPGEKGKRELVEIPHGGPVVITFRKKPWEAVASRAYIVEMEPSKRASVSDDGIAFRKLLCPAAIWLRSKCEEALRDRNGLWAERRVHESDFIARLDRVTERAVLLRQRDVARVILFIAELLGLDMGEVEKRLTGIIAEQEIESENAVILEAIESDSLFQLEEVGVEELRLSVQKFLRDRKEFVDLSRNRFAEVLKEMEFSREKGPTWKQVERDGRKVTMLFPGLWRRNRGEVEKARQARVDEPAQGMGGVGGVGPTHMEESQTHQTPGGNATGPGEAVAVMTDLLRELGGERAPGAPHEPLLLRARDRGIAPDRAMDVLKRLSQDGSIFVPRTGFYRLTEGLP